MKNPPTVDDIVTEIDELSLRMASFLEANRDANAAEGYVLAGPAARRVAEAVQRLESAYREMVPDGPLGKP